MPQMRRRHTARGVIPVLGLLIAAAWAKRLAVPPPPGPLQHLMPLGRTWSISFDQLYDVCFSRTEEIVQQVAPATLINSSPRP